MPDLTTDQKQAIYRDARFTKKYDGIWQNVGKCVFCDLREKYIFFEEHGIVMTVSLYAYIDGHLMIMPRRHVRSPRELTQLEWDTIRKFSYIAKKIIREVHGIKGMQIVQKDGFTAQSTVNEHLHFHCIPFDAPDLCYWNYRKLKNTPLQNAALYKNQAKKIIKLTQKFDQKYKNPIALPIVCDLLAVNTKNQILFQNRRPGYKLSPDVLTIPGGIVENFETTLQQELVREVTEETGWAPSVNGLRLVASRVGHIKALRKSVHLQTQYKYDRDFMWNTYLHTNVDPATPLTPADDCDALVWINAKDVAAHPRISPGIKQVIADIKL